MGGDDRELGVRSEPPNESNEEKGPRENYCPIETDSQTTEKVRAEEMQNFYLRQYAEWAKWYETQPETYDRGEPPKPTWGLPNEKGKGQGPKGGTASKNRPRGIDF